MSEKEHTSTPADEAIMASLLTVQTVGAIQQAHVNGHIDLETYNTLYYAAARADTQVRKLVDLLDIEPIIQAQLVKLPDDYPTSCFTKDEHGYKLSIGNTLIFHSASAREAIERTRRYVAERDRQPGLPVGVIDGIYD